MKLYDIKIGIKSGEKTFWKTIGTVFTDDNAKVFGSNGKPATFNIDYPATQGIITKRETPDERKKRQDAQNANQNNDIPDNTDNSNASGNDDLPF
jgi:hypothetical protein